MNIFTQFYYFFSDLLKGRKVILELTKKDFQAKYIASYLGIVWAFIQPAIYIALFWFVFQVGFKSAPVDKFPFILWLMAGMLPWMFFSESLSSATHSITDLSFLVKKVVFRVGVLPIVKILSVLFVHVFFILVLFIMFFSYGYLPSIYNIQILYYLFAGIVLTLGLSWITSSMMVFIKDVGQIVLTVLQFAFWLTPIFWSTKIMPEKYHFYLKLNPVYYLVEGYREAFIYKTWFWQNWQLTVYFWVVTIFIFVLGALLFRRLKPHFADVL